MKKWLVSALGASLALSAGQAFGVEGVRINGFLTAGATYADTAPCQGDVTCTAGPGRGLVSQDGNIANKVGFINDSRFGLQISAKINSKVDLTGQLLSRARNSDYAMKANWAFVTYHLADPLAIRAGKLKLTTFLISDYIEVGYAYPWIRPPQEVYYSNPISTINGIDALYRLNFGRFSMLVQPYYGTSSGEQALVPQEVISAVPQVVGYPTPGVVPSSPGTVAYTSFTADSMYGINISGGTNAFTLRGGYLKTLVSAPAFGVSDKTATFSSVGGSMDWKNIVLYAEYFQRRIQQGANEAFPDQKGWYTTLGYRIGKFLPNVTFAKLADNNNPVGPGYGTPLAQSSVTGGLRYELGTGADIKFEAEEVKPLDGTRGLLIGYLPTGKTHVMIYSVAIDLVF
ncbi:MAG: porin [Gammaproteobacteria bacterium]|nr:porin [Gammaproteobacteria bacterium]